LPGQAYTDTIRKILGNSSSGEIIGRFAADRPELAEEMLKGAQLAKSKGRDRKPKAIRPMLAAQIKGQLYPTAEQQNAVIEASLYLDMARRNARGALYDSNDTSGLKRKPSRTSPASSRRATACKWRRRRA
jgi:hypothetical protein